MLRSLLFASFIGLFFLPCLGQKMKKPRKVRWDQWYDSAAFFQGPAPLIVGADMLSDSLSKAHMVGMVFESGGKYYRINSLADYYYWFTRKYDFLFRKSTSIYEQMYFAGVSFELARFVRENYKGKKLPVKFRFPSSGTVAIVSSTSDNEPSRPVHNPKPHFLNDH